MNFLIADIFTDSLAELSSDEKKSVKIIAFDLQTNPTVKPVQLTRNPFEHSRCKTPFPGHEQSRRTRAGTGLPLEEMAAFGISGGFGMPSGLKRLFMTHPPLEERIAALESKKYL